MNLIHTHGLIEKKEYDKINYKELPLYLQSFEQLIIWHNNFISTFNNNNINIICNDKTIKVPYKYSNFIVNLVEETNDNSICIPYNSNIIILCFKIAFYIETYNIPNHSIPLKSSECQILKNFIKKIELVTETFNKNTIKLLIKLSNYLDIPNTLKLSILWLCVTFKNLDINDLGEFLEVKIENKYYDKNKYLLYNIEC